jgi:hypothetical protein
MEIKIVEQESQKKRKNLRRKRLAREEKKLSKKGKDSTNRLEQKDESKE